MAPNRKLAMALPAAGCLVAAPLFVPSAPSAPGLAGPQVTLQQGQSTSAAASTMAVGSVAAVVVAAASARSARKVRSALRAEPISAVAAAAAAKAAAGAAAAKGAAGAAAAKGAAGAAGAKAGGAAAGAKAGGASTGLGAGTGKSVSGKGEDGSPESGFDPAKEVGVTEPLGFFDPAGFSKAGDKAGFRNLRAAEIKHGRVAMMAAVGAVAQHYVKFPGFESVPAGMDALTVAPGSYGFAALFAAAGALELGAWVEDSSKEPGNFGDPAGLNMYTTEMREKEINNGRMAMFAALGIIAANLVTGKDAIEQFA